MAIRYYFMPLTGTGTRQDPRLPKYRATDVPGGAYTLLPYGAEPICCVRLDVTPAQHTALTAHTDVLAVPADLTQPVGASLPAVQNGLEILNIPSHWLTSTHTYRQVLRGILTVFMFVQTVHGVTADRLFASGITLNTPFSQLPAAMRQALQDAAARGAFDASGLTGATTLRQLLQELGDQWRDAIVMHEETF